MKRLVVAVLLIGSLRGALLAQSVILTPTDALGFDYLDADLTSFAVARFEVSYDLGAWTSLGLPAPFALSDTIAGAHTYKVVPQFTTGSHSVQFRACNAAGCGSASAAFPFAVESAPASAPAN